MNQFLHEVLRDLAPAGVIRAAINYGNPVLAQKGHDGEPEGVSVDLARELGRRLDRPVELVTFDAAGQVFEAVKAGGWDIAFLAIDPVRAQEISFTAPYVVIEGTYLVRDVSPFRNVVDLDREGVRISVGQGAAYDLHLTRSLKHAELVRATTSAGAMEMFLSDGLDAAAGVKQPLMAFARAHAGLRVIEGRFTAIQQAIGTPHGRPAGLRYLSAFVEDVKANGFLVAALGRSQQHDASDACDTRSSLN
jgi:polar amino acid transport system substrate-binding protein